MDSLTEQEIVSHKNANFALYVKNLLMMMKI